MSDSVNNIHGFFLRDNVVYGVHEGCSVPLIVVPYGCQIVGDALKALVNAAIERDLLQEELKTANETIAELRQSASSVDLSSLRDAVQKIREELDDVCSRVDSAKENASYAEDYARDANDSASDALDGIEAVSEILSGVEKTLSEVPSV